MAINIGVFRSFRDRAVHRSPDLVEAPCSSALTSWFKVEASPDIFGRDCGEGVEGFYSGGTMLCLHAATVLVL